MQKRIKNIGRLMFSFDIVDNNGKSLLSKKDFNTVGVNLYLHSLKNEDKIQILDKLKLSLSLLQESDKSHHLFYLDFAKLPKQQVGIIHKEIELPRDFSCSHSQIYNLDDNLLTPLKDKVSFVGQGLSAKVHILCCKIRYLFAFLCECFHS